MMMEVLRSVVIFNIVVVMAYLMCVCVCVLGCELRNLYIACWTVFRWVCSEKKAEQASGNSTQLKGRKIIITEIELNFHS